MNTEKKVPCPYVAWVVEEMDDDKLGKSVVLLSCDDFDCPRCGLGGKTVPSTGMPMQKDARMIVENKSVSVRAKFDANLASEIGALYDALDLAFEAERRQDALLLKWPKEIQKQKAFAMALFAKASNDILGSWEILRTGYPDLCQAIMRSAVEAFATAILVDLDTAIYERYINGKFQTHNSPGLVSKREEFTREARKQYHRVFERLNKLAHPTMTSLATRLPPDQGGGVLGGAFFSERMPLYRMLIANEMRIMALEVAGYLNDYHPRGRPS